MYGWDMVDMYLCYFDFAVGDFLLVFFCQPFLAIYLWIMRTCYGVQRMGNGL